MKWNDLKSEWPYIPIVLGTFATVLFLMQGGFGGGHGKFDGLIVVLMLPAIAIVEGAPLPESIIRFDYLLIIAIPTLVNLMVLWLIRRVLMRRRRPRGF